MPCTRGRDGDMQFVRIHRRRQLVGNARMPRPHDADEAFLEKALLDEARTHRRTEADRQIRLARLQHFRRVIRNRPHVEPNVRSRLLQLLKKLRYDRDQRDVRRTDRERARRRVGIETT